MSEGRRHAILIAAGQFPNDPSLQTLRCPKNDVEGLAETLTSPDYGLFSDPMISINDPHHKILPAINRVFKHAHRTDQILIYYSGHGKPDAAGHLYLAASDTESDALETTSIAVGTLRRLIDNYACKQIALILDCCFSGAADKDFLKGAVDDALQQTFHDRGIYILTASSPSENAREKEGDQYSLFTKHILQGIKQGEADRDGDGLISMSDVYEYVRQRVPKEGPQYPRKWEFGIQGGELIIARSAKLHGVDRLRLFREKIKSLDDVLLPEVFDHAYKVIRENQPGRDKEHLTLLESLFEERITISEFSSRWLKLANSRESAPKPQPDIGRRQVSPEPGQDLKREEPGSLSENLNGVSLEMIYVPGGRFNMGSPEGDGSDSERPLHEVTVPSFYIGKHQVTQEQWQSVMGANPSVFKDGKNLPVETISWNDAKEFCKKLSRMTGKEYRLPSEAEWEYACRAGTTGDYAGDLDALGWYDGNASGKTHPVGEMEPNAYGLHDMHGNVWEWCEDVWHDTYDGAPNDGKAWLSGGDTGRRVLRGGSWNYNGNYCRSADRGRFAAGYRYISIGFRVVSTARTR